MGNIVQWAQDFIVFRSDEMTNKELILYIDVLKRIGEFDESASQ